MTFLRIIVVGVLLRLPTSTLRNLAYCADKIVWDRYWNS